MISADVKYWVECIDAYNLHNLVGERTIFVWGAYSKGQLICQALEKRNLAVEGYIDGHKLSREYCGKPVCSPDEILSSRKHYIVIALEGVRGEIIDSLRQFDYESEKDYLYFSEIVPEVEISGFRGNYIDMYNNSFQYEGKEMIHVNIIARGGNNSVRIGSGFCGEKGIKIILGYGSTVELGRHFHSTGEVVLDADMGGEIRIGNNFSAMDSTNVNAWYGGNVEIGDYVSAGQRLFLSSGRRGTISISDDCMFSHDVSILGTNGHSILDIERKKTITPANEGPVSVGSHVWLAKNTTILSNTKIGDGSIVGACSLAKGQYPEQSIIAGNIAKVIRSNCTWDRRREITYEQL